jgi:hypothetical protein
MEECVCLFFFLSGLFALLFVPFFLCIISPAYGILLYTWARRPFRISILLSPVCSLYFCYGVCTHLSLPEWKMEQMSADK